MTFKRAFLLLVFGGAAVLRADDRIDKLDPVHKKWLQEEVTYIITDQEKEVFLSLPTVEDRARFVEAFWDRRDPDPASPENEFKKEHYERLDYANKIFSRDAPRPGWKTDMGRFWIILGKPHEIQRFDGLNEVVATQVWFYNGDTKLGQPPRFNLVFFKQQDIGEYELYSPMGDGPEALLRAGSGPGFRTNQNLAVDALEIVSMDLARASLTVDLTEPVGSFLSARNTRQPITSFVKVPINVEAVVATIEESRRRGIDTGYLDGYLRYKDKVTADYSFRFVPGRRHVAVFFGPEGTPFVHYSFELDPQNFSLQANDAQTAFYTTLEASVEVRDPNNNLVAVSENTPYIELSTSQMRTVAGFPFAYHDDFPVLPGDYRLSFILKNRATKQFTADEVELRVDPAPSGPGLGGLLLGYKTEIASGLESSDAHRVFQLGREIVYPSADGTFTPSDTVYAMIQTWKTPPGYRLRTTLGSETSKGEPHEKEVGSYEGGAAIEAFPLSGLAAGPYRLRAELLDANGTVVAERSADLSVSPRTSIPRAGFVYRHSFNIDSPGLLALAVGQQHMARGELAEAEASFQQAVDAGNPDLVVARWKLATSFLYSQKVDAALELLLPLAESHAAEPEVVEGLGLAYYLKNQYSDAVRYLESAVSLRPPDAPLLNALGDSYQNLGEPEKAREVFERSLALNPSQEAVRTRLDTLAKSQ